MNSLALLALAIAEEPDGAPSDLIEAARSGDRTAFETLMRQNERLVLATALRLLGNLPDAQDASQEVFFRLYRNLRRLDRQNLPGWLYRVTVNVCRDLARRRPATEAANEAAAVPDTAGGPQELAVEAERRAALALSLRMLPEKERAALVLRDLEGLSTAEVARALGTTEATVRSQISKARLKVKDFLERYQRRRR
jgi:RNA polymerase sigma-70 factor (ECF subfamily)